MEDSFHSKSDEELKIKVRIQKYKFFRWPLRDVIRAWSGNSQLGSFILAICCVDYLSNIFCSDKYPIEEKGINKERYEEFIRSYLGKYNNMYKRKIDETLDVPHIFWSIRNDLVHVYGESFTAKEIREGHNVTVEYSHERKTKHLLLKDNKLHINITSLISDLIATSYLLFGSKDYEGVISYHCKKNNLGKCDNQYKDDKEKIINGVDAIPQLDTVYCNLDSYA